MSYIKVTLLNNIVLGLGVDWANAGQVRYWKVLDELADGDVKIKHRDQIVFLTADELTAGEKIAKPNLSYPTGMHFKLEKVADKPGVTSRLRDILERLKLRKAEGSDVR